jgi:7-cyano-7-deazaguanine synthase in queuosine biosynthesis
LIPLAPSGFGEVTEAMNALRDEDWHDVFNEAVNRGHKGWAERRLPSRQEKLVAAIQNMELGDIQALSAEHFDTCPLYAPIEAKIQAELRNLKVNPPFATGRAGMYQYEAWREGGRFIVRIFVLGNPRLVLRGAEASRLIMEVRGLPDEDQQLFQALHDLAHGAPLDGGGGDLGGSANRGRGARTKRGVILFSGGMDSVTLAVILKKRGYDLIPFFMSHRGNVGNVTKKEMLAASRLAKSVLGRDLVIIKPETARTPKWYGELGIVDESEKLPVSKQDKDWRNRRFLEILHEYGMADEVVALGTFGTEIHERTLSRAKDVTEAGLQAHLRKIGGKGTVLTMAEFGDKAGALRELPAAARKHVLASESCLMWFNKPCGDCWSCMDRVKSITAAWGSDSTPYRAGSKADVFKNKKGRGSRGQGNQTRSLGNRRRRGRGAKGDVPFQSPSDIPVRKARAVAAIAHTGGTGTHETWEIMDTWVAADGLPEVLRQLKRIHEMNTPGSWTSSLELHWISQLSPPDTTPKGTANRRRRGRGAKKSYTTDPNNIAKDVIARGVSPFWQERLRGMADHAMTTHGSVYRDREVSGLRVVRVSKGWPLSGTVTVEREDGAKFAFRHKKRAGTFVVERK